MARRSATATVYTFQAPQRPNVNKQGTKSRTGYRWVDRDPLMEDTVALLRECDRSGFSLQEISLISGVSLGTLYNWYNKKVRFPQWITLWAVLKTIAQSDEQMFERVKNILADTLLKGDDRPIPAA